MVRIVKTCADDYDEYYRIRSSPADIYWNGYLSKPDYDNFRELFLKRIHSAPFDSPGDRKIYLVQIENHTNIGFTQLIRHADCVEIGYSIIEDYQKKGYATIALQQTIPLARRFFKNVIVRIRDDNIASQKVALKNHFIRTETFVEKDYPVAGAIKLRTYIFV